MGASSCATPSGSFAGAARWTPYGPDCRRDWASPPRWGAVATGDLRGDARSEALSGGALVLVWSGDGLAEKFLEARTGVRVTQLELFELDRAFFEDVSRDAEEARHRREERRREREATPPSVEPEEAEADDEGGPDAEGAEEESAGAEQGEGSAAASGEPSGDAAGSERRRRRRRRRGRRGKARTEGGAGPAEGEGSAASRGGEEGGPPAEAQSPAVEPPSGGDPSDSGS